MIITASTGTRMKYGARDGKINSLVDFRILDCSVIINRDFDNKKGGKKKEKRII